MHQCGVVGGVEKRNGKYIRQHCSCARPLRERTRISVTSFTSSIGARLVPATETRRPPITTQAPVVLPRRPTRRLMARTDETISHVEGERLEAPH